MKIKSYKKGESWRILYVMLALFTFFLGSCNDGKEVSPVVGSGGDPFNPAMPIRIDEIYPKTGSSGQRLLIKGENFGNDPAQMEVYIGGKKAPVVNVRSTSMYCIVPSQAYKGDIQVVINNGESTYTSEESDIKFEYQRLVVMSNLLGEVNQQNKFDVIDGPFDNCGGVANPCFMKWDPEYPDILYFSEDSKPDPECEEGNFDGAGVRCIDFEHEELFTILPKNLYGGFPRGRTIDFFKDDAGEYHMIIGIAQGSTSNPAVLMFDRVPDTSMPCGFRWDRMKVIARNQGCQAAAIHQKTGDLYFSNFQQSLLYRVKREILQEFVDGTRSEAASPGNGAETILKVQDSNWEFNIIIHPSGNYAYLMVINQHYILRSDFNGERFTAPYIIAGAPGKAEYADAVGNQARFSTPYQGVFVKNPNYEGNSDEYDFYIADKHNHAIRILTPLGQVSTFAGRGSASLDSNPWGLVNGDLRKDARLNRPKSIAYDERNGNFYIGDAWNHRIRKIALEDFNE